MFTVEEDTGTYTGSLRRHDGYYAGDFTHSAMCTAGELSELARLQPPTFPIWSGMPNDAATGAASAAAAAV